MSAQFDAAPERVSIVDSVKNAITVVNDTTRLLQTDYPLKSDMMDVVYSPAVVTQFLQLSTDITNHLQQASSIASGWLTTVSDRLSQNLVEAKGISDNVTRASVRLSEMQKQIMATEARTRDLVASVGAGKASREAAIKQLWRAENTLENRRAERSAVLVASIFTFFVLPVAAIGLAALSLTALEVAVDSQKDAVSAASNQVTRDEHELQNQEGKLRQEQDEGRRLEEEKRTLERRQADLAKEADILSASRTQLSSLSIKINDCLHTVSSALSSAITISTMLSMKNVAVGIRGLLNALKADSMFTGPLAQLDDIAFTQLDQRITSVKKARARLGL